MQMNMAETIKPEIKTQQCLIEKNISMCQENPK